MAIRKVKLLHIDLFKCCGNAGLFKCLCLRGIQNVVSMQVYGMFQARSTYEGMKLADPNKRPFVLTRAAFIGAHRYAATWSGDNLANWEHLNMSIPMALNLVSFRCFSSSLLL